jgi:hypothetical protein
VRVRSVNQDFFQASRIPLAKPIITELKAVIWNNFPDAEARLRALKMPGLRDKHKRPA